MEKISSHDLLQRAGGATEDQNSQAQAMINRMSKKYVGFKIAIDDVLVMHVAHGMSFEHIEQTLSGMMIDDGLGV